MPKPPKRRVIIEEPGFKASAAELRISDAAIKAALKYIEIPLTRTPEQFPEIPNTSLRRLKIRGYADGQPTLLIWFSYNDTHVRLHEIDEDRS